MSHFEISGYARARRAQSMRRSCVRTLVGAGLAASLLMVASVPADASLTRRLPHKAHQAKKDGPAPIKGPLIIAISIASQRLTVFDDGVAIAHAPVSTGMSGHATPMGVFSVIQKEKFHRSNIYSGAPMPFMQRITWSGVALHAGVLPGYPASHGCIRLPHEFAVKLWGMTKVGARVVITRNEVTPFAFEHLRLAMFKTSTGPVVPRSSELRPTIGSIADATDIGVRREIASRAAIKTADASDVTGASMVDATKPVDAAPAADAAASPAAPAADMSGAQIYDKAAAAVDNAPGELLQAAEAARPATIAPQPTAAETAAPSAVEAAEVPAQAPTATSLDVGSSAPPAVSSEAPSAEPTGSTQDVTSAPPATVETTATIKPPVPVLSLPAAEVPGVDQAALPSTAALPIESVFIPPSRPARPLRSGPISVFVSRKEGKLFARKGFDPLFSVPVTIARPDQPIGTHLFTAAEIKEDGASLRWIAVTMPGEAPKKVEARGQGRGKSGRVAERPAKPAHDAGILPPPQTAAEALDRIELSPELAERISALMSVGASFIISDQGLGYETGLETDFIVVTR